MVETKEPQSWKIKVPYEQEILYMPYLPHPNYDQDEFSVWTNRLEKFLQKL